MKTLFSNNKLRFVTLVFALLIVSGSGQAGRLKPDLSDRLDIQREINVAKGQSQKNVIAFSSRVVVEGQVRENVVTFGGEVLISGEVGKSVVCFGSRVVIKSTAVISEDLVVLGGSLEKEPGCTIGQDTVFIPTGAKFTREVFLKGIFFQLGTIILALKLISLFFGLLLTIFVAGLFPRQVYFAAGKIRTDFWPILSTGFLAIIIYLGLIMLSALLIFVIIGIPLLILLMMGGIVFKIFGGTAFSYFFGESFLRALGVKKMPPIIWTAAIGLVVVAFLGLIPVAGPLFSLVVSLVGWGVALRTRFGTLDNWFSRN